MYIKKLELSNFQAIKEFNADFEGNVYSITGDNELGKSTLLKAIGAMLTGNRDAVLKNGEDKGLAKMDKDELGAVRHAMTAKELNDLYKSLENFIADCTRSEVDANRDALNKVQTMIHQRMRLTTK